MMCAIMFVSTVSALTLTPMLCSQLLRLQRKQSKMFRIFFGPIEHTLDGLDNWYARMLNWAVRHRMVVLVGCVIFLYPEPVLCKDHWYGVLPGAGQCPYCRTVGVAYRYA